MLQKLILKATGDLTGNKIADKITSADKSKEDDKTKKVVIYIPPEKRQIIIDDLKFFQHYRMQLIQYKNRISKNYKFT